jgi:hypothetical protein
MTAVRALTAELATTRERALFGFCVYCSRPTLGLACKAHFELLALDPYYSTLRTKVAA